MKYVIAIIAALAVIFGIQAYINSNNKDTNTSTTTMDTTNTQATSTPNTDRLIIEDTKVGTGTEAKSGDKVTVNYTGMFTDGKIFDSSRTHGQPFTFTLGGGQVIKGWDEGVVGMKIGGERKLTVPPSLGYGPQDYGPIPGNSTLIFDVELLKVE